MRAFVGRIALLALAGCGERSAAPPDASATRDATHGSEQHAGAVRPRLVVLYVACTVNRSFLAPYAPEVAYTPALADFARSGVVFRRHVSESGQSGIDFATVFSGTQADGHGVYSHPATLAPEKTLIAESFAAAGYDTFFWSGHPMAAAKLGYGQGVPEENVRHRELGLRDDAAPQREALLERMTANDAEFAALLERLERDREYRAFVQVAFTVSHEPYPRYAPEAEVLDFVARFPEAGCGVTAAELAHWLALYEQERQLLNWDFAAARARYLHTPMEVERLAAVLQATYAACIRRLDGFFGELVGAIERRGLGGESLVAFTVDHGELLYRENALFPWTHGLALAPEILDVPWILRAPGIAPGDYAAVTRSIDVFPTLAGLCGVEVPASVQGTDLAPVLRGERPAPRQLAFSHTPLWSEQQVRRFSVYPLVRALLPRRDPELMSVRVRDEDLVVQLQRTADERFALQAFDLARDPGVAHDLYDAQDERHARLAEELARYKRTLVERFVPGEGADVPDEESLERLRAMGYAR